MMKHDPDERDITMTEIGPTGRLFQGWQSAGDRFRALLAEYGFVPKIEIPGHVVSEEAMDQIDAAERAMKQAWWQYWVAVNK